MLPTIHLPDCLFFFQAEDGIRDLTVTGVQTCALPISVADRPHRETPRSAQLPRRHARKHRCRSEERRVGKECRSRGGPGLEMKKRWGRQDGTETGMTDARWERV